MVPERFADSSRDLGALNVRDFLEAAANRTPHATFLLHEDEAISYADFNRRVDRAAAAWHRLGVRKGDRVAFMLQNSPEFLEAWLGLSKVGGILVAINTRWQPGEVEYFLRLTEPRITLAGRDYRETMERASAGVSRIERALTNDGDEQSEAFRELQRAETEPPPRVQLRAEDPISFISTSGTTGRPKAVMQTHGNYVLTGEGYATWVEMRPDERIYLCLPLFHINSQAYTVMGAIAAGASIALVERFSASRFWPDMKRYQVNVFNYIGSMIAVLMKREPVPEEREHQLRLTYGGPAFPGETREEIERRFGLTLISGIGMSENTFGLIEPLHGPRRSGTLGKVRQHPDPRLVNEAKVVDDERHAVPDGEVGELIYRNSVLMKGYYRDPEQTAQTIRDGWLYTGDLVWRDPDGYFYFVDRKKEIIRVRGENVASVEIEEALSAHPAVGEVAAIGVQSELTDEDVAIFVVPAPGSDPGAEELMDWCRGRLASFKVPRYVWFAESLPKTETLRVEKHRLRERARAMLTEEAPEASG